MPTGGTRLLAIATTLFVAPERRLHDQEIMCGIVKWCRDAVRFAASLPLLVADARDGAPGATVPWYSHADVLVSTNDASAARRECDEPSVMIEAMDTELVDLAGTFAATSFDRGAERARVISTNHGRWHIVPVPQDRAVLTKWAVVGLTRYELILLLDTDIDLLEQGRRSRLGMSAYLALAAKAWSEGVPRFRASRARLLGSPDTESPLNTGTMWLKPSRALYDEGIALLRLNRFSVEFGFNSTGRPRALMPRGLAAKSAINATRMMRLDNWNFVGGSSDQGLFTLIFAMRHDALELTQRGDFTVHHFWASSKPWVREASCLPYFHQLGLLDGPGDERGQGDPPRVLPLPPGKGVCFALLHRKAAAACAGLRKRWRCRGASFPLF